MKKNVKSSYGGIPPSIERALEELNSATTVQADRTKGGFKVFSWPSLVTGGPKTFLGRYFRGGAWRRGSQGLLYCLVAGYYTFIFNLKIWEQRRKRVGDPPDRP